ncbi:hypothetical protein [Solitalea koreensis]|uniref:Lipocalin-like domain-containing protein n=1 Tax=Solitalea koreensis TaxID=543615 RepID=A0A521BX44_9SPHI|nr:hypothetical protein [Solitalea koreensis]SMO51782.1 hypothetical protein SAMN06265350_1031 [Solitalea koreensis]
MNFKRWAELLIVVLCISIGVSGCVDSGNNNRYNLIAGRWLEKERLLDGTSQGITGRQHIFYSNAEYALICGPSELCIQTPPGEWSLLSEKTLQVVYASAINIYTITKIDASNLWLEYREGGKTVTLKLVKL